MNRPRCALIGALLALIIVSPVLAQGWPPGSPAVPILPSGPPGDPCSTNYCIRSQSLSYRTPPGWPAVPIAPCCEIDWGPLPDAIDWNKGVPVMICTGNPDYTMTFPNCGDPNNVSQTHPLDYGQPKIAIGVAWPDPKNYRYEMASVPLVDGPDGTCARYSSQPGKVTNWWVHELKEPKRGSYVFTAAVSFQRGEQGYYAVLNDCKLVPPKHNDVESDRRSVNGVDKFVKKQNRQLDRELKGVAKKVEQQENKQLDRELKGICGAC